MVIKIPCSGHKDCFANTNGYCTCLIGMAPIILAMTHDIGSSRIIIAAILTFYPVATNTLAGLNTRVVLP